MTRLTRSYALANLGDVQPMATEPAEEKSWTQTRNANDTDSEDEDDVMHTPRGPRHGQLTAARKAGKVAPPRSPSPLRARQAVNPGPPGAEKKKRTRTIDTETDHEDALGSGRLATEGMFTKTAGAGEVAPMMRKPIAKKRKVIPPRSPLPSQVKRVVNPGAPDMARPKWTSAEVTAAVERKVALQRQADELEQQRIEMLAEMELEEELEEEEEEKHTVVRKPAHPYSLDDVKDVIMQTEDREDSDTFAAETNEVSASDEDVEAKNATPKKQNQVCSSPVKLWGQEMLRTHVEKEKSCERRNSSGCRQCEGNLESGWQECGQENDKRGTSCNEVCSLLIDLT